jgi:hypothetical protein
MRHLRHRLASVAVFASLALPLSLAAPPALAQTSAEQQQTVEQLASQAYELHQQGKFAESIAVYLKAYEISKASDIIFNVATIYDRKLHERELAADYYRRYIRTPDPNPDLVKRATERLTGLKKEAEEEQAKRNAAPPSSAAGAAKGAPNAPAAPTGPTPEEREARIREGRTWRTAGIIIGAVGVAGLIGSGALAYSAVQNNKSADKLCNGSSCGSQQGVDDATRAGNLANWSTYTFAGGAGLTAIGIVMIFAAPKPLPLAGAGSLTVVPQVSVSASGGAMSLSGAF